jgi:hypothetical protein
LKKRACVRSGISPTPVPPRGAVPDQNGSAHQLGSVQRYLLGYYAAHRVRQHVDCLEAEGVDERFGIARGLPDRVPSASSRHGERPALSVIMISIA